MGIHSRKSKQQLLAEIERLEARLDALNPGIADVLELVPKAILDNANVGFLVHRDWKALYANSKLAEVYKYDSAEEIMSLESTHVFTHPDYTRGFHDRMLRGEAGESSFVTKGLQKDGTEFWEERRSFIVDWEGKPAVCSVRIDVSDRMDAENLLLESQKKVEQERNTLYDAINSFDNGFALFDANDKLVVCNEKYRIASEGINDDLKLGMSFEEIIRHRSKHTKPREGNLSGEAWIQKRLLSRQNPSGPIEFVQHDGRVIQVHEFKTHDGGTALIRVDVTKLKKTEADLRASEERYAFAVSGSQNGLWEWNIQTGEQYFSPRWLEILGYEEGELEPNHHVIEDSLHPDDKGPTLKAIRAHLENQVPYDNEYRLRRKDGSYVWVRSRAQAVWDEERNPIRMAGSINDISHRKKVEEDLRESEARHRRFAADVAHELRTPLSSLLLQLDGLEQSDNVKSLKQDVGSMSRLVEQLLALARLDTLTVSDADVVDLGDISKKVAIQLGPIAIKENRSLEVLGADKPVLVHGNADALEQAVRNLVENAIKYSSRGSLITTKVDAKGTLEVIDRGQGVPKNLRKEIFGRFERSDRRSGGCGLGLSIVQRTIEAHGGTIDVRDTPGGGATFSINMKNTIH